MPLIIRIEDFKNINEISAIAHKEHEPVFVTKNGYSDLVIMSSDLYDSFTRENSIDQAIYYAEKEFTETGEYVDADVAFVELEKKYFG